MRIDGKICNGLDSCNAGGICESICPVNAVILTEDKPVIDVDSCVDCGLCKMNCPREAIYES